MSEYVVVALCAGAAYVVYRLIWDVRDRIVCNEYRALSDEDLQMEKAKLDQELADFFGLKSLRKGCMPNKMLLLRNRRASEEIERREAAQKNKEKVYA